MLWFSIRMTRREAFVLPLNIGSVPVNLSREVSLGMWTADRACPQIEDPLSDYLNIHVPLRTLSTNVRARCSLP